MGATYTQGLTKGNKRAKMKLEGPKKDFESVQEQELIDWADQSHRVSLQNLVREYRDVFPEQLCKGRPPKGTLSMRLR